MSIAIRCPNCGQSRETAEANLGQQVQCEHCGTPFTVVIASDGTLLLPSQPDADSINLPASHETLDAHQNGATKTIGRYTLLKEIGAGAMGTVWLAHDPHLDRRVAIKILAVKDHDDIFVKRFLREARLAASLHHPNVLTVHDVGIDGDQSFIVMELIEGGSLDKAVAAERPMDWQEATRAVRDAAVGLAAAHRLGLIHRDIKPGNLMRTGDGVTKVVDFGLARSQSAETRYTQEGMLLGSPAFMAPELWAGQEANVSSDLYALAITYYSLLSGRVPFAAEQFVQVGHQHIHNPLPDPRQFVANLPDAVCRILVRGAAKDPAARFATAERLAADLDALLSTPTRLLTKGTPWADFGQLAGRESDAIPGRNAADLIGK